MDRRKRTFDKPDRSDRYNKPNEITSGELKANAIFSGFCIFSIIVLIIPKIIDAMANTEGLNPLRYSDIGIWWFYWFEPIFILFVLIISSLFVVILLPKKNKKYRWFCLLLFSINAWYLFFYLLTDGMKIPESEYIPVFPIIGIILLWVFFAVSVYGSIMIGKSQDESKRGVN